MIARFLRFSSQRLSRYLDDLIDRFSGYRLLLYGLLGLLIIAAAGSFFKLVPYSPISILISAVWFGVVCWLTNHVIAKYLNIAANAESSYITGLILALIIAPPATLPGFMIAGTVAIAAIASKYLITFQKSHIFNPAALGAFISASVFNQYPSWWVGTKFLTPFVAVVGLMILRKTNRFTMAGVFLATSGLILIYASQSGSNPQFLWQQLIATQVLFFAVIMLSEPLTSPASFNLSMFYAFTVGILYTFTKLGFSPEAALLAGNLLVFIFGRNRRYQLEFIRRVKEAEGIYSYIFNKPAGFKYQAGQYMQWTLAQNRSDNRGNRRYLSLASSPSESKLIFTIKQPSKPSAFKQMLNQLETGDEIFASKLAGEFILPKDPAQKIALLAGGIGVTPFRSMIRGLSDNKQQRDIVLFYSANSLAEVAYSQIFSRAESAGVRTEYLINSRIDDSKIVKFLPDYSQRRFYVSGPLGFVKACEIALLKLGVKGNHIITDYFPGYN